MLLRLIFLLSALTLILSGGMYLFTGRRSYLRFVWQVLRFLVVMLLVFAALYILERFVLTGTRILL